MCYKERVSSDLHYFMQILKINDFLKELQKEDIVHIFADGACSGNPGPGGWGAILSQGERGVELFGGEKLTTNNRMELMAAIEALRCLPAGTKISLTTDSQYLKNGIELWIRTWKKNSWKTAGRTEVKNKDLWETLDSLCEERTMAWSWVKGHSGHLGNERADALARQAIARFMVGL